MSTSAPKATNGDSEIAAFADALVECYSTLGELTGGSVVARDGLLMVAGPHRRALVANTAIRTDPTLPPATVFRRRARTTAGSATSSTSSRSHSATETSRTRLRPMAGM